MVKDELTIIAFSDYRIHSISLLEKKIDSLHLNLDLILYGGDDTNRFVEGKNHFQILAKKSKYGLGAVIGNDCQKRDHFLIKGKKVFDVHRKQIKIGPYVVLGWEGCEINDENQGMGYTKYKMNLIKKRLATLAKKYRGKKIIIVSHSPPYEVLDFSVRFGRMNIGSKAIREFIEKNPNVILNICGHSHMNGGKSQMLGQCLVLNVSNHDSNKGFSVNPGRFCKVRVTKDKIEHIWGIVDEEFRSNLGVKPLTDYIK